MSSRHPVRKQASYCNQFSHDRSAMVARVMPFMSLIGAAIFFSHSSMAVHSQKGPSENRHNKIATPIIRSTVAYKNDDVHQISALLKNTPAVVTQLREAAYTKQPPLQIPSCAIEILDRLDPPKNPELNSSVGLDALYILHYPALKKRRATAERQLADAGLQAAAFWMTQLNKEDMTPSVKSCMVASDFGPVLNLAFKHVWAYYHTWKNQYQHVLVLEDDFQFEASSITAALRQLVADVPADYTTVQVSTCLGMRAYGSPSYGKHLYGPGKGSRCLGGYLISKRGAELMLRNIFVELHGITMPPDWQQNGVVDVGGYWYDPALMVQSSEGGERSYEKYLASFPSWGHAMNDNQRMMADAGLSGGRNHKNHQNHSRLVQVELTSDAIVTRNAW